MTTVPLGLEAYNRQYAHFPEVQCFNRFVEKAPTNLREHTALLTRPATKLLAMFPPDTATGRIRGTYSYPGVFNNDLFVVSGKNLWRYNGTSAVQIAGQIQGLGNPRVAFRKGEGYEHMFIADSLLLNVYTGGTKASGVLTNDGSTVFTTSGINIGAVYYGWNVNVNANTPDGTITHPFLCLPGANAAAALANMANMINFMGTPGTDFSSVLAGANQQVRATSGASTLTATARTDSSAGNSIGVGVQGTTHLAWNAATLTGGGTNALKGVVNPNGEGVSLCATLGSYVWVGVNNSQKFYYVRPGEIIIDPLMFALKESQPDPLSDLVAVGDVMIVIGTGSTEFWSATGNSDNPFAPITGRAMSRGAVPGTAVMIDERTVMLVGNDGKVYSVGSTPTPVSTNGIEERIRRQLRREAGLSV